MLSSQKTTSIKQFSFSPTFGCFSCIAHSCHFYIFLAARTEAAAGRVCGKGEMGDKTVRYLPCSFLVPPFWQCLGLVSHSLIIMLMSQPIPSPWLSSTLQEFSTDLSLMPTFIVRSLHFQTGAFLLFPRLLLMLCANIERPPYSPSNSFVKHDITYSGWSALTTAFDNWYHLRFPMCSRG